jgi:HEPN domain-containing protein/predicted nucleotidyltransferase
MRYSIEHLPQHKQHELQDIVKVIREYHPTAEMIILFGSYTGDNWVEERAEDGVHYKYQSDYDILAITEKEYSAMKLEQDNIMRKSLREVSRTPVSVIAHDIDFVNRRLRKAQYFFNDVKNQGICLYDSGKFTLKEPKELTPQERQKLAKEDLEYWFNSAGEFFKDFEGAFNRESYNNAAFLLHQVTERLLSTILLVFTRYKPNTHDLETLYGYVNSQQPEFLKVFPQSTPEEKRRFELLRKAYVDARYKPKYKITAEELTWLAERVELLREMTQTLCEAKIESFIE